MKVLKKNNPSREQMVNLSFNIIKFNKKIKPNKNQIMMINCFSEFGCEIVGVLYNLRRIRSSHPGKYIIAIGWNGRDFLYKDFVDEFWELKEEFQWLRNYARAFGNRSKNLSKAEAQFKKDCAIYISPRGMGDLAMFARCSACQVCWGTQDYQYSCPHCKAPFVYQSLFGDPLELKKYASSLPKLNNDKLEWAKNLVKPNSVGIFARGRTAYGRNLPIEFYKDLIYQLEGKGYSPIWMGEKVSVLPCPVDHILDFTSMEESKDLEKTLCILKQCKFTIQYWTASTRLASLAGIPYILFESPDQIWGAKTGGVGQEGIRRILCDFSPNKLVIRHYLEGVEKLDQTMDLTLQAIDEVELGNYEDIFGLTENHNELNHIRYLFNSKVGKINADIGYSTKSSD